MSSGGTGPAKAALAASLRSRESPSTPTSFCSWIMSVVCAASIWARCCMNRTYARVSARTLASLKVERISTDWPDLIRTRGKRFWSAFTQVGTKLEMPFFQLPNQRKTIRWLFFRAPASRPSTREKSNFPSCGSTHAHATATSTVLRFNRVSLGQTVSM